MLEAGLQSAHSRPLAKVTFTEGESQQFSG